MIALFILLFYVALYGMTMIVVQSHIFKPFRSLMSRLSSWLGYLFNCMLCTGFWMTLLVSVATGWSPMRFLLRTYDPVWYLLDACAGAAIIYVFHVLVTFIEDHCKTEF